MSISRALISLLLAALLPAPLLRGFDIQLDYTYDTLGFFADATRRNTLEAAARAWEDKLAGAQTPAIPLGTGGNTWTLSFNRPDRNGTLGSTNTSIVNKPLPANTVVLYVGGRPDVYGGYLGYAEFSYSAFGNGAWLQTIQQRNSGERFASFGGAIAFDSDEEWHFDPEPGSVEAFPEKTDFYTLAMHEIGHLLGFTNGSAAFNRLALGGRFNGPRAMALNGGTAPDLGIGGHWPQGFRFQDQPMVMAPSLGWNQRAHLNPLEVAAVQDLGYGAQTGVRVVLAPSAAVTAGAQWRLDGGPWKKSGDTLLELTAGTHTVSFQVPATYLPMADQVIELVADQVLVVNVELKAVPVPVVVSPPSSVLAEAGKAVALEVQANAGGAVPRFQWRKGKSLLRQVTGQRLEFAALKLTDAGSYEVVVSTPGGSSPAVTAQLGVVGAVTGATALHEGGTLKLKQAASGMGLTFAWRHRGQLLEEDAAQGISGTRSAQLQIKGVTAAAEGEYQCVVGMPDPAGGQLECLGPVVPVSVLLRPVVEDVKLGPWRVSGGVTERLTATSSPTQFQVSGLPRGVVMDRRTGQLSGRPLSGGAYRLLVSASNTAGSSALREFWVDCEGLAPQWQGQFSGLVERSSLNGGLGGMIALTVSSTGGVSGHLLHQGRKLALRGVLETLPGPEAVAVLPVSRGRGLAPWQVKVSLSASDGHLTGRVEEEGAVAAAIEGWQSAWHARTQPATAFAGDLAVALQPAVVKTVGAEGTHSDTVSQEGEAPPEGAGYATARVSSSGLVTWTGRLADGSVHTQSVVISAHGCLPLHSMLYDGGGSIQGWTTLSARSESAPVAVLDGVLDWCKQRAAHARDRAHAAGFPLAEVAVEGGSRTLREVAVTQLQLDAEKENNVALVFSGACLEEADLGSAASIALTLTAANRVLLPLPENNPAGTRLTSVSTTTNLFTGSFMLRDTDAETGLLVVRRVTFQGLLVPRLRQGVGWFLLPDLTSQPLAPQRSGRVVFEAAP